MAKLTNGNKNVVEVMAELMSKKNMQMGIDEIEFPDGSKEKFYYNGEEDRKAAIEFAQICLNATNDSCKAKQMMAICFALKVNNITPTEIVEIDGVMYYVDHERKILCDKMANIIVELEEDEKDIQDKKAITLLLKERAINALAGDNCDEDYDDCDDEDYDDEDYEDEDDYDIK